MTSNGDFSIFFNFSPLDAQKQGWGYIQHTCLQRTKIAPLRRRKFLLLSRTWRIPQRSKCCTPRSSSSHLPLLAMNCCRTPKMTLGTSKMNCWRFDLSMWSSLRTRVRPVSRGIIRYLATVWFKIFSFKWLVLCTLPSSTEYFLAMKRFNWDQTWPKKKKVGPIGFYKKSCPVL